MITSATFTTTYGVKVYDINQALLITTKSIGDRMNKTPTWLYEALYMTLDKEFFLVAEGGTQTKYGIFIDGAEKGKRGSTLIPLKREEAKAWLKTNEPKMYYRVFGEEVENQPTAQQPSPILSQNHISYDDEYSE